MILRVLVPTLLRIRDNNIVRPTLRHGHRFENRVTNVCRYQRFLFDLRMQVQKSEKTRGLDADKHECVMLVINNFGLRGRHCIHLE